MAKKKGTMAQGKKQQFSSSDDKYVYPIEKFVIEDKVVKQAEELISYYRQFPFMFVKDYLNIELYDFQKILLYEMMHNNYFVFCGCRSIAKTWLTAVYICTRCILYPKTKVIITASEKQQSAETFTKILDLMKNSQMLREEIADCSDTPSTARCYFWNGSTVKVATMSDGSRHYRANLVIVDEYVTADPLIIQSVITAFLGDPRFPLYLTLPKYKTSEYDYLKEVDTEIYMSSVGHKSSWAYNLFEDAFKQMVRGNDRYFVCALPYKTAVKSGLRRKDLYIKEMSKSTTDQQIFDAEYSCVWMTDAENGYYKYDMLDNCRSLQRATYLNDLQSFVAERDKRYTKKKNKKDEPKEIIIIGADIASVGGKKNDLSAFCVLKLVEKNKITKKTIDEREQTTVFRYYDRELIHLETHEGMLAKAQAERLKRLYAEYGASYIVIDAMNCGSTILQLLAEPTDCSSTGEEYPPMRSIYDDDYALMCQYNYATKCIVPITAGAQSNHDMADRLLGHIAQRRIKLLVDDKTKAKDYLYSIKGYDDDSVFNNEMRKRMLSPYKETSMLISEMIALEKQPTTNNLIKLKEPAGKRKDRYSAFLYANGFADTLQDELITSSNYDEDDDVIDVYMW